MQGSGQWSVSRLADEEEGRSEEQVVGQAMVCAQSTQPLLLQDGGGES